MTDEKSAHVFYAITHYAITKTFRFELISGNKNGLYVPFRNTFILAMATTLKYKCIFEFFFFKFI